MAVALLAGFTVGLSPSASAHGDTNTVAQVTGTVTWPPGSPAPLPGGLDGCTLANAGTGLPVGDNDDLCFVFDGLVIQASGIYEGVEHATDFTCGDTPAGIPGATGVSGLSGVSPNPGALGAFYGVFECAGAATDPTGTIPFVASAHGHFHGLSKGTTIAFLGAVCDITPAVADRKGLNCDLGAAPIVGPMSVIKHTIACKGEVTPDAEQFADDVLAAGGDVSLTDWDKDGNGVPDTTVKADVSLECVIA